MVVEVPPGKILFGSNTYNLPELYWLAARWGKRFLSQALAVHVDAAMRTEAEAIDAARLILHGNNRRGSEKVETIQAYPR